MASALEAFTSPASSSTPELAAPHSSDGRIVVVRPQVLENVGHVLGNLFQRIYHSIGRARESDAAAAEQLDSSTRQLEDFLQLVMDYVAPLSLALENVPTAEVAQSLARQVTDIIAQPVRIDVRVPVESRLLVDPGRLARAFSLLALQLHASGGSDDLVELNAMARAAGRTLGLSLRLPAVCVPKRSSVGEMHWAVAEKLLEIHGGTLDEKTTSSGEIQWEITLPLQS